ncbi:MAG TPA: twin transmembrane helix small protein [Burkholderiaceae bacterium]|nr:twin transmembrane helix small protein [Burkholderiaceae bacterium]
MKLLILLAFLLIFASLFSALVHMMRGQNDRRRMARALTVRISLSVLLFVSLLIAHHFGWIQTTGFAP